VQSQKHLKLKLL